MVTAEAAVVLPVLVAVSGVAVWACALAAVDLRCVDVAGSAAAALARGESRASVLAAAARAAPAGASVTLRPGPVGVEVDVRDVLHPPGPLLSVLRLTLTGRATAPATLP